jgi:predicted MFS family arabinose efflux permease
LVPPSRERRREPLDPLGALLSIAGLGTLIYAIIEAPNRGWMSVSTGVTFAVAALILVGFAAWELRTLEPMLDLRFFRNPRFTAATSTITLIFFVMFGSFFIITQYLQSVLGYSPLSAGVRILPWAAAYMLSATRSARLVERFGQRAVVSTGLVIVAGGLALMSRSGVHTSYGWFALALVITAFGMGWTTAPSTGAIMRALPLEKAGVGSAVNDTTRELGGALGVAALGSILSSRFHIVTTGLGSLPAAATRSLGSALQTASTLPGARGELLADHARRAYVHAFDTTLAIAVAVALAAAVLISWLLRPARSEAVEEDHEVAFEAA